MRNAPFIILSFAVFCCEVALADVESCDCDSSSQSMVEQAPPPTSEALHYSMQDAYNSAKSLDWFHDSSNGACKGQYLEPGNINPESNLDPGKAQLFISSDNAEQNEQGFMVMSGNVEIYHGSKRLRSDQLEYSKTRELMRLSGEVQMRDAGILVTAASGEINNTTSTAEFTDTLYVLHEQQARGSAEFIKFASETDTNLVIEKTRFTVCPPDKTDWSFNAKKLTIDNKKGWGKIYHTTFDIKDVPVFYIPYLDFPIDDRRKTGILWPSISSSENGGIDFTLPVYFNLAPNYDMTYLARYNSDHGYLHGLETRYKNKVSEWSLGGTYINNDNKVGDNESPSSDEDDRWLGFIKEKGDFNEYWSSSLDYQAVSDINYLRDWGVVGLDVRKSLNIKRTATINHFGPKWAFRTELTDYDRLELDPDTGKQVEEDYRLLPNMTLTSVSPLKPREINLTFHSQYTYFDHDTLNTGHRLYFEPGVSIPFTGSFYQLNTRISTKNLAYSLSDTNDQSLAAENSIYEGFKAVSIPSASIDARLFIEKFSQSANRDILHTITPRIFYYYAKYEDQSILPNFDTDEKAFNYEQLFLENPFSSIDRITDANQITWAIENDLFDYSTGQRLFSFYVGQILYQHERRVSPFLYNREYIDPEGSEDKASIERIDIYNNHVEKRYYRNASDIASKASFYIDDSQNISLHYIWDPYKASTQEIALGYHFRKEKYIANTVYRYKKSVFLEVDTLDLFEDNQEQIDTSFYAPLSSQWHAFARWNYDVKEKELIENVSGLRYESCCWNIMVGYQKERRTFADNTRISNDAEVDYLHSWYIQFELKGLGSVTNTITRLLEESIQGY